MARAGAVSQFRDRVFRRGGFVFFVWPGLVVIRVTTGTIRPIGGKGPLHDVAVSPVAVGASEIATVIPGICSRHMTEDRRCPYNSRMALITFAVGHEMIDVFARSLCTVVAPRAGAGNYRGVIKTGRAPCNC